MCGRGDVPEWAKSGRKAFIQKYNNNKKRQPHLYLCDCLPFHSKIAFSF